MSIENTIRKEMDREMYMDQEKVLNQEDEDKNWDRDNRENRLDV